MRDRKKQGIRKTLLLSTDSEYCIAAQKTTDIEVSLRRGDASNAVIVLL